MRLIDADLLKKNIAKWLHGGDPQETEMVKLDDIAVSVIMEIEEQPTAYDVDAVVEQLEEYAKSDVCYRHDGCPYRDDPKVKCENCGALGALDIVRSGGKSE